jgi:hypothetical protein
MTEIKYDIDAVLGELCAHLVEGSGPFCPFCGKTIDKLDGGDSLAIGYELAIHVAEEHIKGPAYDSGMK